MDRKISRLTVMNASFLVGGTCIGGGMLALPVATAAIGFIPSLVVMFLCWAFMTITGLLILEVNLWMEEGVHMVTMTSRLLGPIGKITAWLVYLFVGYASLVAYTSAGGELISHFLERAGEAEPSRVLTCSLFAIGFGLMLYLGGALVGRINSVLFTGLIVAYLGIVGCGFYEIKAELITRQLWNLNASALTIPLLLTVFSYQLMVPSLTPILKNHGRSLRISVIAGTTIALVIYIAWQAFVLGTVPFEGSQGLRWAAEEGRAATASLRNGVQGRGLAIAIEFFSFFALVTSFLGIALGLFDFLADGLKVKKRGIGNIILGLLVMVPTLFFAIKWPGIFLAALYSTGGYGDAVLTGILPALMVWKGRYWLKYDSEMPVPGGRVMLVAVILFSLLAIGLEAYLQLGTPDVFGDLR